VNSQSQTIEVEIALCRNNHHNQVKIKTMLMMEVNSN